MCVCVCVCVVSAIVQGLRLHDLMPESTAHRINMPLSLLFPLVPCRLLRLVRESRCRQTGGERVNPYGAGGQFWPLENNTKKLKND